MNKEYFVAYDPNAMVIWGYGDTRIDAMEDGVRWWVEKLREEWIGEHVLVVRLHLRSAPVDSDVIEAVDRYGGSDVSWEIADGVGRLKPLMELAR